MNFVEKVLCRSCHISTKIEGWLCGTAEAVDCGANLCLAGQLSAYDVVLDARDLLARVIALHTRRIRALYALCVHDQERAAGVAPVSLGPRQPDFFKKTLNRFLEAVYDLANDGSAKAK